MYDNTYFVFVFDASSINLVAFDPSMFGKTYKNENIAMTLNNNSQIRKIKGYSTGDYRIRGDYKYLFITHEVQDGKNLIRKYEILPDSKTMVKRIEIDLGVDDITCIELNKEYMAVS